MKKILSILLLFISVFLLFGCNTQDETEDNSTPYFVGKVIEDYGESCLVEVTDVGNGNFSLGSEVVVNTNISSCPKYTVGDYIKIRFDGKVAYSYPPQVLNVFTIIKTDKSGSISK